MGGMRPLALVLLVLALGCAKKESVVPAKDLTQASEITEVVKEGWSHDQVLDACGAPKDKVVNQAPNVDEIWSYDVPTKSPTQRVQVFFLKGSVVSTTVIPFGAGGGSGDPMQG